MRTKREHAAYMRRYMLDPVRRNKKRELDKIYSKKNRAKAIKRATEWYKRNKEHRKIYLKKYFQINKKRLTLNNRKYDLENKERLAKIKN